MAKHILQDAPRRIDLRPDEDRLLQPKLRGRNRAVARGRPLSFGISESYIEIGINSASEFVASATTSINYGWPGITEKGSWAYQTKPPQGCIKEIGGLFSANLHHKSITCMLLYATISNGGAVSSLHYNACLVGAALCEVVVRECSDEDQIY
jgi:hypothetical protein